MAFKDIKYAAIKIKSDANNAKVNDIGRQINSDRINIDPIKTVAPIPNAAIPVLLLDKFNILPIKSEKKVPAVKFSRLNKALNNIPPIEQPAPALQI